MSRSFNTQGVYIIIIIINSSSSINHLTLHNLLKLYAFHNPTISYTQGMNFIMGFIYTVMEDEELTFRCFASLINNKLVHMWSSLSLEGCPDQRFEEYKSILLQVGEIVGHLPTTNLPTLGGWKGWSSSLCSSNHHISNYSHGSSHSSLGRFSATNSLQPSTKSGISTSVEDGGASTKSYWLYSRSTSPRSYKWSSINWCSTSTTSIRLNSLKIKYPPSIIS